MAVGLGVAGGEQTEGNSASEFPWGQVATHSPALDSVRSPFPSLSLTPRQVSPKSRSSVQKSPPRALFLGDYVVGRTQQLGHPLIQRVCLENLVCGRGFSKRPINRPRLSCSCLELCPPERAPRGLLGRPLSHFHMAGPSTEGQRSCSRSHSKLVAEPGQGARGEEPPGSQGPPMTLSTPF